MSYASEKETINSLIQEINYLSNEILNLKGKELKKKKADLKTLKNILKIKKKQFLVNYTFDEALKEEFGSIASKRALIDWFINMQDIYTFSKDISVKNLIEIAEHNGCKVVV